MLFNSPMFLFLFLPGTVTAYIVLRQLAGPRAVLGLLVAVSLVFYGWWNPLYVPLLGSLAVFNFLVARAMAAQRRAGRLDRVSWLLTFGIVGDLLALGYFKYTDFLIDTANVLLQTDFALQYVLLPIGVSFIIFQKIAYLVDSSRGEVADHDFLEYCFFVSFFQQLREEGDEEAVFKKIMIGDLAAAAVDEVGDFLKDYERDTNREKHVLERKIGLQQDVGGIDQEIGIFEIAERQQVADDAKSQQPRNPIEPAGATLGGHCSGNEEIEHCQAAEQRHVERVPPAIKYQGDGDQ